MGLSQTSTSRVITQTITALSLSPSRFRLQHTHPLLTLLTAATAGGNEAYLLRANRPFKHLIGFFQSMASNLFNKDIHYIK